MENLLNVSIVRSSQSIIKSISIDSHNNQLKKKSSGNISSGTCTFKELSQRDFVNLLNNVKTNECIVLGKCNKGNNVEIIGCKNLEDIDKNQISRNLENFQWNDEFQLLYFDYDGNGEKDNLMPNQFIDIISEIIPQFKDMKKIVKYSSSAHIYNAQEKLLSKNNGFHIYFLVNHSEKIEEIFKGKESQLAKKLQISGRGFIKNSNPKDRKTIAVTQMLRTIVDHAIFSPERIIFEAEPILDNGLIKKIKMLT